VGRLREFSKVNSSHRWRAERLGRAPGPAMSAVPGTGRWGPCRTSGSMTAMCTAPWIRVGLITDTNRCVA